MLLLTPYSDETFEKFKVSCGEDFAYLKEEARVGNLKILTSERMNFLLRIEKVGNLKEAVCVCAEGENLKNYIEPFERFCKRYKVESIRFHTNQVYLVTLMRKYGYNPVEVFCRKVVNNGR